MLLKQEYRDLFKNIKGVSVKLETSNDFKSNFWLSCITFNDDAIFSKEDFQNAMQNSNIETRPLWKPMHMQPVFKGLPYYGNKESEVLFKKGICLPSGSNLSDGDRERITKVVKNLLK